MEKSEKIKKAKHDPNVVGLEESSEDEESSESDEDEPEVIEKPEEQNLETVDVEKEPKNESTEAQKVEEVENIKPKENKAKKSSEKVAETVKIEKKPLLQHPTIHIEVKRDPKIQVARLKLPILGEEQRIMELVNENEFLIVAGETGKYSIYINMKFFVSFLLYGMVPIYHPLWHILYLLSLTL